MQITEHTTVGDLKAYRQTAPDVARALDMCCPPALWEAQNELTLRKLEKSRFSLLQAALNATLPAIEAGRRTVLELYSAEEIRRDPGRENVRMLFYPGRAGAPFVVILPGGGYTMVAMCEEGIPAARAFSALGYNAFVLRYRIRETGLLPKPMDDLNRAVDCIAARSGELGVDGGRYAVAGFSAGGYLAGLWCGTPHGFAAYGQRRPETVIGAYPLISLSHKALMAREGMGNARNLFQARRVVEMLCGPDAGAEQWAEYDADRGIGPDCPPVYLIHGDMDNVVYFRHSELLARALEKQGIPHVLRLVENAGHAFGDGAGTGAEGWIADAAAFWRRQAGGTEPGADGGRR